MAALGLTSMRRGSWGPCPACGADRRGAEDERGPLATNGPKLWKCFACGAAGDGAALVAAVALGTADRPGPDGWARARAIAVERGLVASEGAPVATARNVPNDRPPAPSVRPGAPVAPVASLPDAGEVTALWNACGPVDADPEVSGWLRSRRIDPALVAELDLARVVPSAAENALAVATWTRFGRASWGRGWRLILPCFNAAGELVTLRARWAADGPVKVKEGGGTDVAAGPAVYADPMARELLRGATPLGWDGRVIVVEGGPDFLTLATSTSGPAVFGVWAGAWPATQAGAAFAERLPARARVCLATDANDAGDRYADTIGAHLAGRTWCRVRAPQLDHDARKARDWNDLARAGERPLDLINAAMEPEPEVEPMADKRSAFARLVTPAGPWLTGEAPPPIPSLVTHGRDPVMARGISAILASPGGCGKTTAALELALLVAAGGTGAHSVRWLNRFHVEGGRVLYVNGEDHGDTLHRRLHALAAAMFRSEEDRKRAGAWLDVAAMAGEAAALVNANGDRTQLAGEIGDHLASSHGWALVVIDPVARFGGQGDENDNRAATQLVNVCERFTRSPGWPSVLLLHHTRKLAPGANGLDVEQLRGASGFKDAARWVAMMAPGEAGKVAFKVVKNNDGPQSGEIELRRDESRFVAVEPKPAKPTAEQSTGRKPKVDLR